MFVICQIYSNGRKEDKNPWRACEVDGAIKINKKFICKSQEGNDVYENDEVYMISYYFKVKGPFEIKEVEKNIEIFQTIEKAEEWILYNKPCLSLTAVEDILNDNKGHKMYRLKDLATCKL
jgi:hypothetical protein